MDKEKIGITQLKTVPSTNSTSTNTSTDTPKKTTKKTTTKKTDLVPDTKGAIDQLTKNEEEGKKFYKEKIEKYLNDILKYNPLNENTKKNVEEYKNKILL